LCIVSAQTLLIQVVFQKELAIVFGKVMFVLIPVLREYLRVWLKGESRVVDQPAAPMVVVELQVVTEVAVPPAAVDRAAVMVADPAAVLAVALLVEVRTSQATTLFATILATKLSVILIVVVEVAAVVHAPPVQYGMELPLMVLLQATRVSVAQTGRLLMVNTVVIMEVIVGVGEVVRGMELNV